MTIQRELYARVTDSKAGAQRGQMGRHYERHEGHAARASRVAQDFILLYRRFAVGGHDNSHNRFEALTGLAA